MDNNKDRKLLLYLTLGATLGAAYLAINYLSNRKTSTAKPLPLDKTRKILQQIKFQILTTCTTFVQGLQLKPKTAHSQKDLEIFYRTELAKVYEMRQDTILSKFIVSKDEFAASLAHYKKDQKIQNGQKQIFQMLENAIKSTYPDYTVPRPAKALLTESQILEVYLEMCELISISVWKKLDEQKQKNPGFNSKDDTHFKKAIREISIYDIKVEFLKKKGFQPEWGCPNQVFYKVMETVKQANKEIKNKAAGIEKAYEKVIQRITNEATHLNPERIKFLFDQLVNNKAPQVKPAPPQPQPKKEVQPTFQTSVQNAAKKPVAAVKKNDDFNMDDLMMQELLSRSQQEPKEVKKVEVVAKKVEVAPVQVPKVEQVKPQVKAEVVVERVQEVVVKVEAAVQPQVQAKQQDKKQVVAEVEKVEQKVEQVPVSTENAVEKVESVEAQPAEEPVKVEQKVENVQNEPQVEILRNEPQVEKTVETTIRIEQKTEIVDNQIEKSQHVEIVQNTETIEKVEQVKAVQILAEEKQEVGVEQVQAEKKEPEGAEPAVAAEPQQQ